MKRVLSLVLALVMVLGMIPTFAAEATGAELLLENGFITGKDGADLEAKLDVNAPLTREQLAALIAELRGEKEDASIFAQSPDYTDVDEINAAWALPYVAYAQVNGFLKGYPDGSFRPQGAVPQQQLAAVLLNALGYTVDTDAKYATAVADLADLGVDVAVGNLNRGQAFEAMWKAVSEIPMNGTEMTLGQKLGKLDAPVAGVLAVTEVKAASSKAFEVTFNRAVDDEEDVAFTVTRGASPVTVSVKWNAELTVATLESSSSFAQGEYTVVVKNADVEIKSSVLEIVAQKLSKIEITSTKLSVTAGGSPKGYATFKAYDQYGVEVTSTYHAAGIQFQTGVGTILHKDGLMTLTPSAGVNLAAFPTVTISGFDTNTGTTVTKTLETTTAVGTLSSFELGSVDNIKLVAGDVSTIQYIPYVAKDLSGNETKNYEIISKGLVFVDSNLKEFTVTNSNVTARLVQDPSNPINAAIEIKVTSTANVVMDMPLVVTSMTYTGSVSSVSLTLLKASAVANIVLMAPTSVVAQGERAYVPFEAYDQAGKKVTRAIDLDSTKVTLNGLERVENIDGTLSLRTPVLTQKTTYMVSAVVNSTGKLSTVSIPVQETAVADSLVLNNSSYLAAMEHGSTYTFGFGYNFNGGLEVRDQYNRKINMVLGTNAYVVKPVVTGDLVLEAWDPGTDDWVAYVAQNLTVGKSALRVTANDATGGSGTITFRLYADAAAAAADVTNVAGLSSRQITFSVIPTVDIVDYTMSAPSVAYATNTAGYQQNFNVVGKTASGASVKLAAGAVVSASVTNSAEFQVHDIVASSNRARIKALPTLVTNPTGSTTEVSVNVNHNGKVTVLKGKLDSSTVAPIAKDISFGVSDDARIDGDLVFSNNTLYVKQTAFRALTNINDWANDFGFDVEDSYGKYVLTPSNFSIASQSVTAGTATVNAAGALGGIGTAVVDDYIVVTAVTSNGLYTTVKIQVVAD